MEIYNTEEQQEEAIKRFLKENGASLVIGAFIGLAGIYGWNYYQKSQIDQMAQESLAYSQVTKTLASPDASLEQASTCVAEHADTQYSQLTQLLMVKALVEKKEFDQATTILKQVVASNVEQTVKSIAFMRLARIEMMQLRNDDALATLAKLNDSAFDVQKNELKGDIFLAQGDQVKARSAYQSAMDAAGDLPKGMLEMKLNDLTPAA